MPQSDELDETPAPVFHDVQPSPPESKRPRTSYNLFDEVYIGLLGRPGPKLLARGRVVTIFTLPYEIPVYHVIDVIEPAEWPHKEVRTVWDMASTRDDVLMSWEDPSIVERFMKEGHTPSFLREFQGTFPTEGTE